MNNSYQRQDSVSDQMSTVMALAVAAGCYDAHDWLQANWNRTAAVVPSSTVIDGRCSVVARNGCRCVRMKGHTQRHRYDAADRVPLSPEHVPLQRAWVKCDSFKIPSGSKTFTASVGGPCKVRGERGDWKIISVECHPDGRCNVEVTKDRTGASRIFPSSKIIYKRPRKSGS